MKPSKTAKNSGISGLNPVLAAAVKEIVRKERMETTRGLVDSLAPHLESLGIGISLSVSENGETNIVLHGETGVEKTIVTSFDSKGRIRGMVKFKVPFVTSGVSQ